MNMTPERLNQLADWLIEADAEELLSDEEKLESLTSFLRECAKCEPVYLALYSGGWIDLLSVKDYELRNNRKEKRILYTAPSVAAVKVPDEVELKQAIARGWCSPLNSHKDLDADLANAITEEVLRINEVK